MSQIKYLLIVANSGRMLACFANKVGVRSLVIDCYADMDMQASVLAWQKVQSLTLRNVELAFNNLNKLYDISHVIFGSGLEQHLNTFKFLNQKLSVIGNTLDVFSRIQNKAYFFSKLEYLNIPYPETSFDAPSEKTDWLIKPMQGEGGIGIKKYTGQAENSDSWYWQKYSAGTPMSVLFVANETEHFIVGFQKQFFQQIDQHDFIFSGVLNQLDLTENIKQAVNKILTRLVAVFSLKGINTLDFIVKNDQIYILEINARPSASMQLYNQELLSIHINSCLNAQLLSQSCLQISQLNGYQIYNIVFAKADLRINENIQWPVWVTDRPVKAAFIHTGMPICSIIASGKNEQQVLDLLKIRKKNLLRAIGVTELNLPDINNR